LFLKPERGCIERGLAAGLGCDTKELDDFIIDGVALKIERIEHHQQLTSALAHRRPRTRKSDASPQRKRARPSNTGPNLPRGQRQRRSATFPWRTGFEGALCVPKTLSELMP
jgi:hypothetical protein